MECINKGFFEVRSSSTVSDSNDYHHNDFDTMTANYSQDCNQNISGIFHSQDVIEMYLESIVFQNSGLTLLKDLKTLLRQDHEALVDSVKILSGGAATTDPLYSGFIGPGMLTGAVFGGMKKSPPSATILEVLRTLSHKNEKGILVIVVNSLANRLNFGSACQKAAGEGIKTLLVNVGEDVSGVSIKKSVGRRGLCGIAFLYKVAGAMSEEKKTIYEIHNVIEKLKGNCLGTISVGIRRDKMIIGPGCKGDPEKICFLWDTFDELGEKARLQFIVKQAISYLFHPSSYFSLHVVKGDKIVVIVNNLGHLSDFYLALIVKEVQHQLNKLGFIVMRIYNGRFFNSNTTGFSISALKVTDSVMELLDRPVSVMSWPDRSRLSVENPALSLKLPSAPLIHTHGMKKDLGPKFTKQQSTYLLEILPNVVETVENMKEYLNKLDDDHDFGTTINKFTNAIKTEIENKSLRIYTPYGFMEQMAHLAGTSMGGVSGGVFDILFSSAAQAFLSASPMGSPDTAMWVEAARAARDGLLRFTRVKPGDGTIIDALHPFVESATENTVKGLSKQVTAAVAGAEGTTSLRGSRRSSVVSDKDTRINTRNPDPGALCIAVVIRTVYTCLQTELLEGEESTEVVTKANTEITDSARSVASSVHTLPSVKTLSNVLSVVSKSTAASRTEVESKNKKYEEDILLIHDLFNSIAEEIEQEVPDECN